MAWVAGWVVVSLTACTSMSASHVCSTGTRETAWQVAGIVVYVTTAALFVLVPTVLASLLLRALRCRFGRRA